MATTSPCPCCKNPWSRPEEFFAMACGECTSDSSGVSGLDPANMDPSVSPADDFYRHANGGWIDANPVPGEYPAWNTFLALHDANLGRLKALLEGLAPPSGAPVPAEQQSVAYKVAAFWRASNDEAAIDAAGLRPLEPVLAACELATTDKTAALAKLHAEYGVNAFFALGEGADDKDSAWTLHQLSQAGLGLPDRDYYFDEDKADKRELYAAHVHKMLAMLGDADADAAAGAAAVLRLETALAASHLTRTERRDPDTTYNRMAVGKLSALCKGAIEWPRYLELAATHGAALPKALNVDSPVALATAMRLFADAPAADVRAYLRWCVALSCAPHLPSAFVDAHFEFYSKALSGQQEQKPRWKRAMPMVEAALGDAVGQLYVERYFSADAKGRALHIVSKVRAALEARLREVPWMQDSTRAKALDKMRGFGVKIGFPDEWIEYASLDVRHDDHLGNVLRARAFEHARQMRYADAPTDKTRWMMLPQQINAYYHPNLNEIVFPAAILQPPFFNADADDAVNYGSFGAVVGHEMSHGFDDQGSQFDASGNLHDWWAPTDKAEYEARVRVQVEQASRVRVHGRELNGKLTCGENIADLGGLRLAYRALAAELAAARAPAAPINGFSPQQRFFLAWAQVWRENTSKENALKMLAIDPHGPNSYRTNGPVANMEEFHRAFGVPDGAPMWRAVAERVDIW